MFKFRYGKIIDEIDIIPNIAVFFIRNYMDDCIRPRWNFYISIQWILWYVEIIFGKGARL